MKIVIAPQGFKGGISGLEAAQAIARGVIAAVPDAETVLIPVADGGDGTLHALVDATGGQIFTGTVTGPINQQVEAQWGVMGDGRTAVIEMARASGLAMVPSRRRNPKVTTTLGTGEILREALERGYRRVIVGLGGSATNDGGAGMATALGARFLDSFGNALPTGGGALARLARIDTSGIVDQIAGAEIIAATDVTNPLCGPTGASAVYGPQKGASEELVAELDAALLNFARVVSRDIGCDVLDIPGAGAAGGLGAGLMAFAGAKMRSGIDMVCQVLDFDSHLVGADLVITGEGRADRSTVFDKAPVGVARHARDHGVPTVLLAGSLGDGHEMLYDHGVASVLCISDGVMTFEQALSRTGEMLEGTAERAVRLFLLGNPTSPVSPP
jgi:glycerate kinase